MSKELLAGLREYASTDLGSKIIRNIIENNGTVNFIEVFLPSDGFGAVDLSSSDIEITYTSNLQGWKNSRKDFHQGNQVNTATIGSLLAHEFGHTNAGRNVLNFPAIKSINYVNGKMEINPNASKWEEVRTVKYFENAYREQKGMPLRTHYVNTDIMKFKEL